MTDRDYLVALSTFTLFGPVRTKLLLSYFKSAKNIWNASKSDLLSVGLKENLVEGFIHHREKFDIEKYFKNLGSLSIKPITINDKDYPTNLKETDSAPYVLYSKGILSKSDVRSVAIVGTRMPTSYGKEIAQKFAGELGNLGITVVSGLALGIDAISQKAAIAVGGRTISVLASGLNIISPLTNKSLAIEFIKSGQGAVVSEYPIGYVPRPFDFPVRDRLISGLSKAVIVIEGRAKSGTFYTVTAAAEQGRPVFAVPGPITSPASEGPNYLIQNGAKPVTNIRDVLDELNMQLNVDSEAVEHVMPSGPIEGKIIEILKVEPLHLDELVRISGVTVDQLSARLTIMEMKGMVKSMGGGIYKKI